MNLQKFYRHNPDNIVLYRNFVDGIIRGVWAKENFEFSKIDKHLEKYIKLRLEMVLEPQNNPFTIDHSQMDEQLHYIIQFHNLEDDEILKSVFDKNLALKQALTYHEEKETTMNVKTMLQLLERAGIVETDKDRNLLFSIIERFLDPGCTYTETRKECLVTRPILMLHNNTLEIMSREDILSGDRTLNSLGHIQSKDSIPDTFKDTLGENSHDDRSSRDDSLHHDENDISIDHRLNGENSYVPAEGEEIPESDSEPSIGEDDVNVINDAILEGILGNEDRNISEKETLLRKKMFDMELADSLSSLMGYQMLFFEFVENLVLFCMKRVRF